MKTLLCTIGRLENQYIREFVNYYSGIGFTHIELYDNNMPNEEHFEDVIGDYSWGDFVSIIDYRGKRVCQLEAYQECYERNKDKYDWIAFFDCDEFLHLDCGNITEFLSSDSIKDADMVHVNWVCYDDNDNLKYEDKPVLERFTRKFKDGHATSNMHIKTIVKCGTDIRWNTTSHTPTSNGIKCVNSAGKPVDANSPYAKPQYENAYIKHFITKSIEEFIRNKRKRSYPDSNGQRSDTILTLKYFFDNNEYSKEKEDFGKKILSEGKKKLMFMSMVCNNNFFLNEERICRETWAKGLDDTEYYAYLGSTNVKESILDKEKQYIITNTEDGLWQTFSKTKEAFRLVLENYDFDYIVRTNSSTYLNVDLIREFCENIGDDDIWGTEMYALNDFAPRLYLLRGNLLIIPRKLVEKIAYTEITEKDFDRDLADDTIIALVMKNVYGDSYIRHLKVFWQEWIEAAPRNPVWGNTDFSFEHLKNYLAIQVKKYFGKRSDEIRTLIFLNSIFSRNKYVDYKDVVLDILSTEDIRRKRVWMQPQYKYETVNDI